MKNILLILLVCSSLSFASDNLSKDEYIKSLETELKMYKHKYGEIKPNEKNGLSKISEVLTFHVRSVSKTRFDKKLGQIPLKDVGIIKKTLNDILKY